MDVVYTYSGILFSPERKGILTGIVTWIKLDALMLSEISQIQKDKYCDDFFHFIPRIAKFIKIETRMVVARGWEVRRIIDGYTVPVWKDKNFWKWMVMMVAQCECSQGH
jgi:hypothetical protein